MSTIARTLFGQLAVLIGYVFRKPALTAGLFAFALAFQVMLLLDIDRAPAEALMPTAQPKTSNCVIFVCVNPDAPISSAAADDSGPAVRAGAHTAAAASYSGPGCFAFCGERVEFRIDFGHGDDSGGGATAWAMPL